MDKFTVKGSQYEQPLLEFSGACAGCGETPYMKPQLFGERMVVSNATGCTQAWGFSVPSYPYTTKPNGRDQELKAALSAWLEGFESKDRTIELSDAVIAALNNTAETGERIEAVRGAQDQLVKKSMWMYGGDGWAYDIGYGGLDHVLASGEDVNILVVDTEVYSNTGGQSSKATPFGAVAQFAAAGKRTEKKDLGMLATQYQNVYVASVALGADPAQYIKALREAEAHDGPSLIVAYAPCINHGIVKGMAWAQEEAKLAVKSGYWVLYRYDPKLKAQGKNPFTLDFKEPKYDLREFFMGEVRFNSLQRTFPEAAEALLAEARNQCRNRWARYTHLAAQDYSRLLDVLEDYPIQEPPASTK